MTATHYKFDNVTAFRDDKGATLWATLKSATLAAERGATVGTADRDAMRATLGAIVAHEYATRASVYAPQGEALPAPIAASVSRSIVRDALDGADEITRDARKASAYADRLALALSHANGIAVSTREGYGVAAVAAAVSGDKSLRATYDAVRKADRAERDAERERADAMLVRGADAELAAWLKSIDGRAAHAIESAIESARKAPSTVRLAIARRIAGN